MSGEGDIDKRLVHLRIPLETCRAVEKGFSRPGDTAKSTAFIRALEEATRGIPLTPADYAAIKAESDENLKKRHERRAAK